MTFYKVKEMPTQKVTVLKQGITYSSSSNILEKIMYFIHNHPFNFICAHKTVFFNPSLIDIGGLYGHVRNTYKNFANFQSDKEKHLEGNPSLLSSKILILKPLKSLDRLPLTSMSM